MKIHARASFVVAAALAAGWLAAAARAGSGDGDAPAGRFFRAQDGAEVGWEEVVAQARRAAVVYVGEQHDNAAHHALQLAVLSALRDTNPEVALGMEMFDRTQQAALDRFVKRSTGEDEFLKESRYRERWGFDFAFYRPMLELAREHDFPALALNAPREVVSKVRERGLAGLEPRDRLALPAIDLDQKDHRRRVLRMIGGHAGAHADPAALDRYYEAMCVWDEVMADSVLGAFLRNRSPRFQVLVIAGRGHVEAGDGIPDRVRRRFPHPSLSIVPADGGEVAGTPLLTPEHRPLADFVFFPKPKPKRRYF